MSVFTILFVAAASLGAYLRYQSVQYFVHPWGTFVVNLMGSLLIGFLAVYLTRFSPNTKTLVLVAFLGSMTTFSSYTLELVTYLEEGMPGKALLYFILSNTLCLMGCFIGWRTASKFMISP